MALPAIRLDAPDFKRLAKEFRKLPKSLAAKTMAAATRRAMQPAVPALKGTTPVGPTGNLKAGVQMKSVRYNKTGTGVAIVGYARPSTKDPGVTKGGRRKRSRTRTFHQFLVEFGSKPRRNKAGAFRGAMPAMHPIAKASKQVMPRVQAAMKSELEAGLVAAGKQMQRYMAARAARGKSD